MGQINRDQLLEEAQRATGLSDWGDLPFLDALDAMLWSIEHEAGLAPAAMDALLAGVIKSVLAKRLRLVDDRKTWPEIAAQTVAPPLVIVGLPRSGSTHLHALMALDPHRRAPLQWEMDHPSPPPRRETFRTDARIARVQAELDSRPKAAEMLVRHPFAADRPEQCIGLLDWSFNNYTVLARFHGPAYYSHFLGADQKIAYAHHYRTLQHLQAFNPGPWTLKHPKHLFGLDALLAVYPTAKVIWTHRDPVRVIPSVADFSFQIRRIFTPEADACRFGLEWAAMEEMALLRGLSARDRLLPESQVIDVHYNDVLAEPITVMRRIYAHFGLPFDEEHARRTDEFMIHNPQNKHGVHRYAPEDYGLSAGLLRERFATYIQRFDVAPDRARG
jgi:hypothetical protein